MTLHYYYYCEYTREHTPRACTHVKLEIYYFEKKSHRMRRSQTVLFLNEFSINELWIYKFLRHFDLF